jgi:alkaline phosphatase isozyme conversion protein
VSTATAVRGSSMTAAILACGLTLLLSACGSSAETPSTAPPAAITPSPLVSPGALAYKVVEKLSKHIGARPAGTPRETKARDLIADLLRSYDYTPEVKVFRRTQYAGGLTFSSANVLAEKQGRSQQEILVAAHYDSVPRGEGALDNATGVALALELARRLRDQSTACTIRFAFFGAEEVGLLGSTDYVETMAPSERADLKLMLDLDSVAGGDALFLFSQPGRRWPHDALLRLASQRGVALRTDKALDRMHATDPRVLLRLGVGGSTDASIFLVAGLPYAGIESMAAEPQAVTLMENTAEEGRIWNTAKDTLALFERDYPRRMQRQLAQLTEVLVPFLTSTPE